ncbi:MAG TPA: helix-turn-helix domain-containing protein [Solirubrobacterales bacterium]|jgi:hypothetical protein
MGERSARRRLDDPTATIGSIEAEARRRLAELAPLLEEAERLRAALAAMELENTGPVTPPDHVPARKAQILSTIAANPGITVAEIAERHGMKRTVVASSVSRLKRNGEIVSRNGGVRLLDRSQIPG